MNRRTLAAVALLLVMFGADLGTSATARTMRDPAAAECVLPPATSPIHAGAREQLAHTSRGPIAYYRSGHGSPLLLVTGFRATLSEWNAMLLAMLAKHHNIIVFDNRGIGRSIPDATSFTVEDMASDTAALIEALHLRRPTVVGWSMGGSIVQQLAIDHPGAIGRMVLMSALAPGASEIPVPPEVLAKLSGAPGVTFDDVMTVLFPPSSVPEAERCFQQAMYRPHGYRTAPISSAVTAGQSALLRTWAGDNAAAASLSKLRIPTLILSGTDDTVVYPRNAEALRRFLPNSRLVTIDNGGHAMMYQYPAALAQDIDSFSER